VVAPVQLGKAGEQEHGRQPGHPAIRLEHQHKLHEEKREEDDRNNVDKTERGAKVILWEYSCHMAGEERQQGAIVMVGAGLYVFRVELGCLAGEHVGHVDVKIRVGSNREPLVFPLAESR